MSEYSTLKQTEINHIPQGSSPKEEVQARAHLEKYLRPGETLIWADTAVSTKLVFHYMRRLLYAMIYIAFLPFLPGLVNSLVEIEWLQFVVVWIGLFVIGYFARKSAFGLLYRKSHYYGLTSHRLLIAVGPNPPKSFTKQDFNYARVYGPVDVNARGRIYFFTIGDNRDDPDHKIKYRFFGIKNAHWVAVLILRQFPPPNSPDNDGNNEEETAS